MQFSSVTNWLRGCWKMLSLTLLGCKKKSDVWLLGQILISSLAWEVCRIYLSKFMVTKWMNEQLSESIAKYFYFWMFLKLFIQMFLIDAPLNDSTRLSMCTIFSFLICFISCFDFELWKRLNYVNFMFLF